MSDEPFNEGRKVLAMCSPLGQPFYAKLGFKEVSTITSLKGSVASVEVSPLTVAETSVAAADSDAADAREVFVSLDRVASGFDRAAWIRSLLLSGNSGVRDRHGRGDESRGWPPGAPTGRSGRASHFRPGHWPRARCGALTSGTRVGSFCRGRRQR